MDEQELPEFCNGKRWNSCSSGQQFYCPTSGDPECRNTQQGVATNNISNLSDEQKIKLTISAKEILDSFDDYIDLERRVTNEYLNIYNQKESVSSEVSSHCEQGRATDQQLMESQRQRFLNQMANRGQLDWSGGAQMIADEEAKERQYIDDSYRKCILMTQSLNLPSVSYKTQLKDWLNRLDNFSKAVSLMRNGLSDGVTSEAEMLDLKQSFKVLDSSFSRERASIDSLRRTIAQNSSSVNYDLMRQLQDSIDKTKKELENPFGHTDITCKTGLLPSSYDCGSLNGSSRFSCSVNQYGFVTCATKNLYR
jgi:hypothetical protein